MQSTDESVSLRHTSQRLQKIRRKHPEVFEHMKEKGCTNFLGTIARFILEILSCYVCRWLIKVFFRQYKNRLALDTYQIHFSKGIQRYWLLMSMAHHICVTGTGKYQSFQEGYQLIRSTIQQEKDQYLFQCAKSSPDFEAFMKLAG